MSSQWSTVGLGPVALHSSLSTLRGAHREVITLSPNRKPHQKRIMFLHKPREGKGSRADEDPLLNTGHTHRQENSIFL